MGVQDFHLEPCPKMFSVYQNVKNSFSVLPIRKQILYYSSHRVSHETAAHHHVYSKHKSHHHLSMHCQNFGRTQFRNVPYQTPHHQENGHNHVTHHFHRDL